MMTSLLKYLSNKKYAMNKNYAKSYDMEVFNFADHWCFFAFGIDQFNWYKKEWVDYAHCWIWLFLPKDTALETMRLFAEHNKEQIKKRIEVMGIDNIIRYEYNNHECDYGSIEDLQFLVDDYGTTREHIYQVIGR